MVEISGETNQKPQRETASHSKKENSRKPTYKELKLAADILESIDDYVSAFDKDWNILYINKTTSKWFGYEPSEIIGKNFWEVFPKFVGTTVEKNYREAMTKREIRRFEWETIYAKSGVREFTVFPATYGVTVYGVDISERKRLEHKLEEYAKNLEKLVEERTKQLKDKERLATIGQTAGMVGHDIRNPLQSVTSSVFLMKTDLEKLPDSEEKTSVFMELSSIQEQISYIDKIVSDLQDYAKPLNPESVETNINELIVGALSTLEVPDNIEASAYFDGSLLKMKTDPLVLKRVLLNLATNAIQAMPKGGKLTVRASLNREANYVTISVKDTGLGIPKELQDKIFTPLFTTKAKGQGFGLAVVKRLVEGLYGKVSFESEEGKGSTFTVILPLLP